jgi:predicted ATPase
MSEFKGISKITISGFKTYFEEKSVEIRPLTIFSGANSSGKSSFFQPLLLMKQTLDQGWDPGALLLDGPHVQFSNFNQLLSYIGKKRKRKLTIQIEDHNNSKFKFTYTKSSKDEIIISETEYRDDNRRIILKPTWSHKQILDKNSYIKKSYQNLIEKTTKEKNEEDIYSPKEGAEIKINRNRCFLELNRILRQQKDIGYINWGLFNNSTVENYISGIIHLPALRGNPKRIYPRTSIEKKFPGTFEHYTASVISKWKKEKDNRLDQLIKDLKKLNLSESIYSREIDDTSVEINVTLLKDSKRWVNLADVGFGVSQTLPILVALLIAEAGQVVYIEQPEIHLHPKAQHCLAEMLINAANRGVKVVVETHSDILIIGIQTLVAENAISPDKIILHWFTRDETGLTEISSADINSNGSSINWPDDFGSTSLSAEDRFLTASEKVDSKR